MEVMIIEDDGMRSRVGPSSISNSFEYYYFMNVHRVVAIVLCCEVKHISPKLQIRYCYTKKGLPIVAVPRV